MHRCMDQASIVKRLRVFGQAHEDQLLQAKLVFCLRCCNSCRHETGDRSCSRTKSDVVAHEDWPPLRSLKRKGNCLTKNQWFIKYQDGTWKPRAKLEAQKEEAKRHRNEMDADCFPVLKLSTGQRLRQHS